MASAGKTVYNANTKATILGNLLGFGGDTAWARAVCEMPCRCEDELPTLAVMRELTLRLLELEEEWEWRVPVA